MEGEALGSRPESPKKKIRSNPVSDSEAQPSNSSESNRNVQNDGHEHSLLNGGGVSPSRRRTPATKPDSSSESCSRERTRQVSNPPPPPRVQEEEVSSSENSVGRVTESEDLIAVCDSASADISDRH